MKKLDKKLTKSCIYICAGGEWELIGGNAPPGYSCPDLSATGGCAIEGSITTMEPEPVTPGGPASRLVGANSASYQFDPATDSLYFSDGKAEPGYKFLPKIPLAELWDRFPSVAHEVELLKHAKSLSSFFIEIPAVAIAHETK